MEGTAHTAGTKPRFAARERHSKGLKILFFLVKTNAESTRIIREEKFDEGKKLRKWRVDFNSGKLVQTSSFLEHYSVLPN